MAIPAVLDKPQVRNAVAGALGGLLGWALLIEPFVSQRLNTAFGFGAILVVDALIGGAAGLGIGFMLGAADDLLARAWRPALRSGGLLAGFGVAGGVVGMVLGEIVFQFVGAIPFAGRAIGWSIFGALLGVATGLRRRSAIGVRNGALGGLIGGAIGGVLFDLVGMLIGLLVGDAASRGVALMAVGAAIGYFIAVIERALATGTLKVVSGRQEGRSYVLDKPRLTLGGSGQCDIVFGDDPAIRPLHATLHLANGHCRIDAEPGAAVSVNGRPVGSATLMHEDQVAVGQTRLVYRRRADEAVRLHGYQRAPLASLQPTPPPTPVYRPPAPLPAPPPAIAPSPAVAPWPVAAAQPLGAQTAAASGSAVIVNLATGQRYVVQRRAAIGRAPDCAIVLTNADVALLHAEVQIDQGRLLVRDLNSATGVFVNGRRINGVNLLKPGWTLGVGSATLRVETG